VLQLKQQDTATDSRHTDSWHKRKKGKNDYTFRRHFNEKPSIIPGCPGVQKQIYPVKVTPYCPAGYYLIPNQGKVSPEYTIISCCMHPTTSACAATQLVTMYCGIETKSSKVVGYRRTLCKCSMVGESQLAWKSDVAASRVHFTKRCTSTTVVTEPEATASMMARDMPMLPSLKQLAMGLASACIAMY